MQNREFAIYVAGKMQKGSTPQHNNKEPSPRGGWGVGPINLHSYQEPRMPETEKTLTSPGIMEPFSGRRRRKILRFSGGIPRVATSQNSDMNHTVLKKSY